MLDKLLKKYRIDVIPLKKFSQEENCWGGDGIIFFVKNGKGLLCEKFGYNENIGLSSLVYDGVPLTMFHGDEHFCPTCEKLISAGYGLDKVDDKTIADMRQTLNQPFESLEKSLKNMEPILGLLPSGYYALADVEMYPTDGDEKFFWAIDNKPNMNMATVPCYDNGNWHNNDLRYVLPTQPPSLFNRDRAEYYRDKDNYRALAYYLDGSISALIDGHHKAVAAAIERRNLKTLVIIPTTGMIYPSEYSNNREGIMIAGKAVYEEHIGEKFRDVKNTFSGRQMTGNDFNKYIDMKEESFDEYNWPKELLESAEYYPNAFTLACIAWAEDISDEVIDEILNKKKVLGVEKCNYLLSALYGLKNPRFRELAFFIGRDESKVIIWENIYSKLAKFKDDEEVENYFIDYLVNDEGLRPEVTEIIDDYLKE